MKSVIAALALLVGANAFTAPAASSSPKTSLNAMDDMIGSVDFRGKEFKFDPVSAIGTTYIYSG